MLLWSAPCPEGTRIHQKPTASSEGAQLWDNRPLTLSWFRDAGPTIVLNIIRDVSVPLRGTIFRWRCRTYPQLRCFAACSGFHDIGPALRNQQLILNLLVVRGCVATAGRHSLLSLFCKLIYCCNTKLCTTKKKLKILGSSAVLPTQYLHS